MKTKAILLGLLLISVISFAGTGTKLADHSNTTNTSSISEEIVIEEGILNFEFESISHYEIEEEITIEKWMIDIGDENWDSNLHEEELKVESWMNNPSLWLGKI